MGWQEWFVRLAVVLGFGYLAYWVFWGALALVAGVVRESRAVKWRKTADFADFFYTYNDEGKKIYGYISYRDHQRGTIGIVLPTGHSEVTNLRHCYPGRPRAV